MNKTPTPNSDTTPENEPARTPSNTKVFRRLEDLAAWIEADLERLENHFPEFQTRKSFKDSMGR